MEKAASSGQFRTFVGGLLTTTEETVNLIDGKLIQKAIDECGSGTTQTELIKWINNGCRLNTILSNTFVVGDVFRHRAEKGDTRLYLSDNTQNWLIKPNLKKVISVRTDLGKLSEFTLPKNMNDTSIQEATSNPGFMNERDFLCLLYFLIFQPELAKQILGFTLRKDKWYIFHVIINGKKVAFSMYWDDGGWYLYADGFDTDDWWIEDNVFLFSATKSGSVILNA